MTHDYFFKQLAEAFAPDKTTASVGTHESVISLPIPADLWEALNTRVYYQDSLPPIEEVLNEMVNEPHPCLLLNPSIKESYAYKLKNSLSTTQMNQSLTLLTDPLDKTEKTTLKMPKKLTEQKSKPTRIAISTRRRNPRVPAPLEKLAPYNTRSKAKIKR